MRPFDDAFGLEHLLQKIGQLLLAQVYAEGHGLQDEVIAVFVYDEAGHAVRFGVDHAVGIGVGVEGEKLTAEDSPLQLAPPKRLINHFSLLPTENTAPNLGVLVEIGGGQPTAR